MAETSQGVLERGHILCSVIIINLPVSLEHGIFQGYNVNVHKKNKNGGSKYFTLCKEDTVIAKTRRLYGSMVYIGHFTQKYSKIGRGKQIKPIGS